MEFGSKSKPGSCSAAAPDGSSIGSDFSMARICRSLTMVPERKGGIQ